MAKRNPRRVVPSDGGFFHNIGLRIKLVLRLLGDSRVSPFLKLIPIASVIYLVIPDLLPGPVDDATVLGVGLYTFVELCPPEVVQEHMEELTKVISGEARDPGSPPDVIDAEFRDSD